MSRTSSSSSSILEILFDELSGFALPVLPVQNTDGPYSGISQRRSTINPGLPPNPLLASLQASTSRHDDPRQTGSSAEAEANEHPLKNLLMTLHLFFPNELLPALDLLDRGLVTKLILAEDVPVVTAAAHQDLVETGVKRGALDEVLQAQAGDFTDTKLLESKAQSKVMQPLANARQQSWYIVRSSSSSSASSASATTMTDSKNYSHGYVQHHAPPMPQFSPRRDEYSEFRNQRTSTSRGLSYEVRLTAWNCTCPAFAFDVVASLTGGGEEWRDGAADGRRRAGGKRVADVYKGLERGGWIYGGLRRTVGKSGEAEGRVPMCKHLLACLLIERCPLFGGSLVVKEVTHEEMAGWAAGWGD